MSLAKYTQSLIPQDNNKIRHSLTVRGQLVVRATVKPVLIPDLAACLVPSTK